VIYIQIKKPTMKVFTKIEEFLATKPQTAPSQPTTKPGTAPSQPTTKPGTAPATRPIYPSRPSPIRRDQPSVEPEPKAKAADVVDRFMMELKKANAPIKFNISKLKQKYES
jgi:hypothetical protein